MKMCRALDRALERREKEMEILQAADAVLSRRLKQKYTGFNGFRRFICDEMLKIHGEILSLGGRVNDLA